MDYSIFAITLLLLGLALLVAEIFLPSGGILSAMVAICIIGSVWCGWTAWWETDRIYFWIYLAATLILLPAVLVGALAVLPHTSIGKAFLLDAPHLDEITPFAAETQRLSQYIGKTGQALTLHSPGGMVLMEGERLHSESEGMLIEPGTPIKVIRLDAGRLVVRAVSPREREMEIASQERNHPVLAADDRTTMPDNATPTKSADPAISSSHPNNIPTTKSEPRLVDFDIPVDDT